MPDETTRNAANVRESLGAAPAEDMRLIVEFEVPEAEADLLYKLIAYARRIGITQYAQDSHDAKRETRR